MVSDCVSARRRNPHGACDSRLRHAYCAGSCMRVTRVTFSRTLFGVDMTSRVAIAVSALLHATALGVAVLVTVPSSAPSIVRTAVVHRTESAPLEEEQPPIPPPFPDVPRPDCEPSPAEVEEPCPDWPTDDRPVVAVQTGLPDPFALHTRVVPVRRAESGPDTDAPPAPAQPEPAPAVAEEEDPPAPAVTSATPLRSNRSPFYPRRALEKSWSGVVELRLVVDASGRVTRVDVTAGSGHACLDDAAVAAARDWRFDPATCDGAPVAGVVLQTVRFTF